MKKSITKICSILCAGMTICGLCACNDDNGGSGSDGDEGLKIIPITSNLADTIPFAYNTVANDVDESGIIRNYIDEIIQPTYKELADGNAELYNTVMNFVNNPTQDNIDKACDEWIAARKPWECSEAFLFGPVADFSLDPSMDSWPLSVQDIKQILASGETPQSEDVKGYHSLEYLLFSDGESRNITSDEEYNANPSGWRSYMQKVAQLLKEDGQAAYDWWFTSPYELYGNNTFSEYFANSYQNPVGQIIEGCWDISGEVGDAKIGDPFNYWKDGQHEAALYAVESWYSWHSRDDYMNNIRSIKYSYMGNRTEIGAVASENSISNLVRRKLGSDYDNNMRKLINNAMNAINNIPQPFRNNIYTDESYTAMDACSKLTQGLKDMQAALGLN